LVFSIAALKHASSHFASMLYASALNLTYVNTTFGERLQLALSAANKTRANLAKVLRSSDGTMGVSASAVGQTINGQSNSMTAENTMRAARFLNVNAFWLATGEGSMRETSTPRGIPTSLQAAEPPATYNTPRTLLAQFRELLATVPPTMRPAFGDVLGGWAFDGGTPDRTDALLALCAMPSKQPTRA
jgi:transcriptional regulator with XRE-family HTH domain